MSPAPALRGDTTQVPELEFEKSTSPAVKFDLSHSDPSLYPGRGIETDPFVVDWQLADIENPYHWSQLRKWTITAQVTIIIQFLRVMIHSSPS